VRLKSAQVVMIGVMAITAVSDGRAQHVADLLQPLVETSARRLNLAEEVAFAKWDNKTAVEDPPREEHVISSAVSEGKTEGLDPGIVSRFFRAQIEANKVVQYSLLSAWHQAGKAPDHQAQELASTIRPQLDEIQKQLIEELISTSTVRTSSTCRADLATPVGAYLSTHKIAAIDVQATALKRSLAAFCPS
jgi:chorismate mutase